MMAAPTLIDMPDPPSNTDTPTEAPGTPNSTTTSLSALSTTAIKDGHRGSAFSHSEHGHHSMPSSNTLEAERADRISRLAGLERVSTVRSPNPNTAGPAGGAATAGQIPGYFDANGNPVYTTQMSTVGSASATGSAAGTGKMTTWASGSTKGQTEADDDDETEADQMSMDTNYRDSDRFSASAMDEDLDGDGISDDTSLVGFGEGAGSTVSGPTYSRSNLVPRSSLLQQSTGAGTPLSANTTATAEQQRREARTIDGLAADEPGSDYVDTAARGGAAISPSRGSGEGVQAVERVLNRLDDGETRKPPLSSPDEAGLGKFYFEKK